MKTDETIDSILEPSGSVADTLRQVRVARQKALDWACDLIDERIAQGLQGALGAFERLDDRCAILESRYLDARDREAGVTDRADGAVRLVRFLDPLIDESDLLH